MEPNMKRRVWVIQPTKEGLDLAVKKKKNIKNFFNKAYKSIPFFLYQRHDLLTEEAISTK